MQDVHEIGHDHLMNNPTEEVHQQIKNKLFEACDLVFQQLPALIAQIIQDELWAKAPYDFNHFGEYALDQSPRGLGIANNHLLWLLKSAMDIDGRHVGYWGDVLNEVDESVKAHAKEHQMSMKDLTARLNGAQVKESNSRLDDIITYLPSRSKSNDGQLLKLKKEDEQTYNEVIQGKMKLKEALPHSPRKQLPAIEAVKHKFNSLSSEDRTAFLNWLNTL